MPSSLRRKQERKKRKGKPFFSEQTTNVVNEKQMPSEGDGHGEYIGFAGVHFWGGPPVPGPGSGKEASPNLVQSAHSARTGTGRRAQAQIPNKSRDTQETQTRLCTVLAVA